MAGGFRMGPFELMDLVGIDVSFEVARSFYELSFGEPRWKPNTNQARMVAAGRLGRKTGRGYYGYPSDAPHRPPDPEPPTVGGGDGRSPHLGAGPVPTACASGPARPHALREGVPRTGGGAGLSGRHLPGGAPVVAAVRGKQPAARGEPGLRLPPEPPLGGPVVELNSLPPLKGSPPSG